MCITSAARRSSLTLQVLPSHLLVSSTDAFSKTASSSAAAAAASLWAAEANTETQPTSSHSPAKAKKSKKSSSSGHHLPHHDGLIVQHHYHDHAADPVVDPTLIKHKAKGGVITPFPVKLHDMLDRIEADGLANVVSWQPHGRCFVVHKPKEFVNHVMPHYFKQTKMASFQRQLNLYGFNRLTGGLDKGGYYHEMFLRGKVSLSYDIHRKRVKGTGVRLPTNPDNEPNFYTLEPMIKEPPTMNTSSFKSSVPPLPALPKFAMPDGAVSSAFANLTQRRAELLRESHGHTMKIAQANEQRQQTRNQRVESRDVVFFEGLPFHYLDPSALPSRPEANAVKQQAPQAPLSQPEMTEMKRQKFANASSTSVVSESDSDNDGNDAFLPSFSPSNMDWDGPLSCPTLQAHMRRSSFQSFAKDTTFVESRPLEDDIETFFQGFDMPVDLYHEQIEHMEDDDDTAFGYLLEQAITE
mmetsp:Transcript_13515/g.29380  ORF Transcript_13515/g.29380 Transcript_13515/m.29380 type:complete len:468 (+) Transcript_13515:117-1520(+)|eukprot:CAMPEP_0172299008 /NCGR_PEP_ID=MMETSP1058-20130122/1395_1 /TAXON_ID=83371 /ORGANISM="Detonula confervacea, Strain CCMP 353" /LENGTH=467 /DNA_ID=CAMNT_0013008311 /DNA_START=117 /DNA_END=1520 /DNA_ORIENTATION=-